MFSLENFYYILYSNLLKPANINISYFLPFGSTRPEDEKFNFNVGGYDKFNTRLIHIALCWDQEPIILENFNKLYKIHLCSTKACKLLANSEHSDVKKEICQQQEYLDWYYFYHGFAALDWYRDYQYLPSVENHFTKVFINLNRLVTKDRSYRLILAAKLISNDLVKHGHVSLSLNDHGHGTWEDEINNPKTKIPTDQIPLIKDTVGKLTESLVVDEENPIGSLSANAGPHELFLNRSALWHVVSETVFYYDKLHLTEKVFKPIISRRPFILLGAPGNLAYLKSYGFKTFDRWINESYDNESDPVKRIDMVVEELKKLCSLSMPELKKMHEEMKDTLEYNFNHLYGGEFKSIIVDELVDNFANCIHQWNHARITDNKLDISDIDLNNVKQLLKK